MKESRTKNSLINLLFSVFGEITIFLTSFITRMVFVRCLAKEYLGLSGVFTNVLSMLSLVELGIGPAITFALYKPLADNDVEKVKSLMKMYRKYYVLIGVSILCAGVAFTPFYRFFITTDAEIEYLDIIYLLYVLDTAVSYFYSYKRSLLGADQKKYLYDLVHAAAKFLMCVVQVIILYCTKNYILYLLMQVAVTWLENFAVSYIADRRYPFLKEKDVQNLTIIEKKSIWTNVKAVIVHKIGGIVVYSTDNLILSKLVGLSAAGIYSNYNLVIKGVNSVLNLAFSSVTASVGNLNASGNQDSINRIYNRLFFLQSWLYGWFSIGTVCIIQIIIRILFGEDYLFDFFTAFSLGLVFYSSGMRKTSLIYRDTSGLYYKDWFKPLLETVFNLFLSIYLLKVMGTVGIFIATAITNVGIASWIESYIVYKHVLHIPFVQYLQNYLKYTCITLLAGVITYYFCAKVALSGVLLLIVRVIIVCIIPNTIYLLFFYKNESFRYYVGFAQNIIQKFFYKLRK